MLTSFFGKSSPVNFLILGIFIFVSLFIDFLSIILLDFSLSLLVQAVFLVLLIIFSMLLLDFIIRKNALTKLNTFAVLFYSCFIAMLPIVFRHPEIIAANVFLLLALRRILSLQSNKNSERKILDASIWITIASLFYFGSLLFLIPLWIAIFQKPNATYKQMLIPFTGIFAVLIIYTSFQLLVNDSFEWFYNWKQAINLDFSDYNYGVVLVPVAVILVFILWTGVYRILKLASLTLKEKPNYMLLVYVIVTALFMAFLGPVKTGAELLLVFGPLSIISANYIEVAPTNRKGKKDYGEFWFKEILLWLVVLLPVVLWFI